MFVQLLAGMFVGAVVASLVWGAVLFLQKGKSEKIRRERDTVMHAIGELWVEIEALVSSRHGGGRAEMEFRERFTSRLDEVNRQLRPNMHLLDVHFVKYTEMLMAHYNRKVFGDAGVADAIADHEMETGLTYVETPPEAVLETVQFRTEPEPVVSPEEAEIPVAEPPAEQPVDTVESKAVAAEEKAASFSPSSDSETKSGAIVEDLFEATAASGEEKTAEHEPEIDVIVAGGKTVEPVETPATADVLVTDDTIKSSPLDDEEDVVFEPKESDKDGLSETVSAASESTHRMFDDEEFSMETMMDVDINTLSSFLKPGKQETPPAAEAKAAPSAEKTPVPSILEEKKEEVQDLEVVIASNASHSDISIEEEPVAAELPEEPVLETAAGEPDRETFKVDDAIAEETTFTKAEDLKKKETVTPPEPETSAEDEFEIMFQEGPAAVEQPGTPKSAESPAESGADQLFEAELTDAESDIITGNDVADKIAALEMPPPSEPKKKKKSNGGTDMTTAPGEKNAKTSAGEKTAAKSASEPKKTPIPAKRGGRSDESITGDDVADKIDAFFGLFDE